MAFLENLNFKSSTSDRCIFEKTQTGTIFDTSGSDQGIYKMVYKTRFEGDKYEPFEVLDTEKGDPFECK